MKQKLFILLVFLPFFSKAQLVFQHNMGSSNYATITVLNDDKNVNRSLFYFSSSDYGLAQISFVKDTVVSNLRVCKFHIFGDASAYYMVFNGLSSILWYDEHLKFICELKNDSHYFALNSQPKPLISNSDALMLLKLLLL